MRVIAVMPAYQEAARVRAAVLASLPHVDMVVVIDDGSKDGTGTIAAEAGGLVLRHMMNRGQGAALKTGNQAALELGADIIVHIDADGQHDPLGIASLVEPIKTGTADVVMGSRFLGIAPEGMPASRRLLIQGIRFFNTYVLGIPGHLTDPQSGYRAMSAVAARGIHFSQDGMAHCSEILRLTTKSWRWQEVPVRVLYTKDSLAKGQEGMNSMLASAKIVWKLLLGSLQR